MAPRKPELKPQLIREARDAGFLALPAAPLCADEALSKHYLDFREETLAKQSCWSRPQDANAPRGERFQQFLSVQPCQRPPRPLPPDGLEGSRLRRSLHPFARRPRRRRTENSVIQHILDEDVRDLFDESDESSDGITEISPAIKATSSSETVVEDPHTEMMMAVAENLVKGIIPGALVSETVQEELAERIWRETRVLHLDAVAPMMYIAKALAANHSWWQVELAVKVITSKLGLREKQELAQNAMCQDQYENFIQDMQHGMMSTQTELMRFDSYAKSSAYQRICVMLDNSKESPEGLRTEQELLLRSLRDAESNLQAVKNTVEDSNRLLYEAKMAEVEQMQWSVDLPGRRATIENFFENMKSLKEKKSAKLEQDFQTAGRRFERIVNETHELEKMAEVAEIKTIQQQRTLEEKEKELREFKEKFRRMKQGSDRTKSEYQAYKQDLEDERETVVTRGKSAQRLLDSYNQQIESLHQDLRDTLMQEVAHEMEQEALRKAQKAKEEREEAQNTYKQAQDRLRLTEDMLQAMSTQLWSGNVMSELIRKKEDFAQLSKEAEQAEEQSQIELGRLTEIRQWLREFGQPEAAQGFKKFVAANGALSAPKVMKSSPIQLTMVLQRLLPRLVRRSKRQESLEHEVTRDWCPGAVQKEQRERSQVLMEHPEIQLVGEHPGFFLRTFYGGSSWRWRLFRSFSAPPKLWKEGGTGPTSPPKSPESKSRRKSMAEGHKGRRASLDPGKESPVSKRRSSRSEVKSSPRGRKALVPEDANSPSKGSKSPRAEPLMDPLIDPGDFSFLSRWAAPPWSRWEVQQAPRARWESTWSSLWNDAKKIFEAVPPDAVTDEGMPVLEGEVSIAYFWQDCHQYLRGLQKVILRNLEGIPNLQRLHNVIENAQRILGERKRAKKKAAGNAGNAGNPEEEREERELHLVSDSARKLLEESREVLRQGLHHQQEQMWFAATLLAQLFGLREALTEILRRLKVLSEEQEDVTLCCRVLVHVSQFPGVQMEVISLARQLRKWQRSVTLNARCIQCHHKTLEEEWKGLVENPDSLLSMLQKQKGPDASEQSFKLEEAIIEVCTVVHCILENRWMRKKVPSVDRKILLDWKARSQKLKAGLRAPLDESAKLPSKAQGHRSQTTALLRSRSRGEGSPDRAASSTSLAAEEEAPMSPDLEDTIAELMAQMVRQQEELLRHNRSAAPSPRPESPGSPGGRLAALSQPRPSSRGSAASPAPNFFLDDDAAEPEGPPVLPLRSRSGHAGEAPSERGGRSAGGPDMRRDVQSMTGRDPGTSETRGVTFAGLPIPTGEEDVDNRSEGERSALGGLDDEFADFPGGGSQGPMSPGQRSARSVRSTHSARSSKSQAEVFEEAYAELLQKRLDGASTPQERAYQEQLLDAAYKEMKKSLKRSDAFFFPEDVEVDDLHSFPLHQLRTARQHGRSQSSSSAESGDESHLLRVRTDSEVFTWPSRMSRTTSGLSLVKSRSWAAGALGASHTPGRGFIRTPTREVVIRGKSQQLILRSPKAIRMELRGKPQREVAAQPWGRRRLMPLLLPWKPQDPKEFQLGSFGSVKGHEARHIIAATSAAPMQSEQDRQLKRDALVYQVQVSRPTTPNMDEGLGPSRPLSATSRPLSAQSKVVASGELHDSASSAHLPGQLEVPGDGHQEPRHGLRHYMTQEDLQNLRPEVPQVSVHALHDVHAFLEENWTPIDKEKFNVAEEKAGEHQAGDQGIPNEEDANDEAYLDAPLDEVLMRPQTPAWLLDIVNPPTHVEDMPEDPKDQPVMALSDFAVAETPETWVEGTPSPWEIRPPTAEETLTVPKPRLPTPCSSRASTGTPRTFVAQGQRCRSTSVQEAPSGLMLPAISGPVMEAEETKVEVPRAASVDHEKPGHPPRRWRPVTPVQGSTETAKACDPRPRSHGGVCKVMTGSEAHHRPISAGGPVLLRKEIQASAVCSAEVQRTRVEGPKPLSARLGGPKAAVIPEIHSCNERRESQASEASAMALAATLAQQHLMAKMKGRPQTGHARPNAPRDQSAKAWLDVLAQANVEPKVQRVLSKGLAAQLTSECSLLATSGKMRIPQRRFHSKS